mgnify:FL=1
MKRDTYNETAVSLRRAFWLSILSVMLCVSMLLGSTMAWFTDSEGFSQTITVGYLGVSTNMLDDEGNVAQFTDSNEPAPLSAQDSVTFTQLRLDPGQTIRRTIVVNNTGSIPFRYQLLAEALSDSALADLLECTLVPQGKEPDWTNPISLAGQEPVDVTAGTLAEDGELTLDLYLRLPESVSSAFAGAGADFSVYLLAMQADAPEDFLTGEGE